MPDPADLAAKALLAFYQQGVVTIPRFLIWPIVHSEEAWDYSHLGQLVILLAEGEAVTTDGIRISRNHPDYAFLRTLAEKLFGVALIGLEEDARGLLISLQALVYRATMAWRDAGEPVVYRHPTDLAEAEVAATATLPPISPLRFKDLADHVEKVFGRPLSTVELQQLQEWHEDLKLSCDLLAVILDECRGALPANRGVTWPWYRRWVINRHDEGIHTLEEYRAAQEERERAWGQYRKFLREMGFQGVPNEEHKATLQRWQSEWGFSDEIILKACAEAWGKDNPIRYANRVLERWHANGFTTLAEVEAALAAGPRRHRPASAEVPGGSRSSRQTAVNFRFPTEKKDDAYYEQFFTPLGRRKGEETPGAEGTSDK